MKNILVVLFALYSLAAAGQHKKATPEKQDTLLARLLTNIPKEEQAAFIEAYGKMSLKDREFVAFMAEMPHSSKKELMANIDTNYNKIDRLISMYESLVPQQYTVYIEFNPPHKIIREPESVDLKVWNNDSTRSPGGSNCIVQQWDMPFHSQKLDSLLKIIHWDSTIVDKIKKALDGVNCISIENGHKMTVVGFARSGMGKYSYAIFRNKLTEQEISQYNDGCENIFYKDNIVLMYGGGAIGPQCFPDKKE
jgi:hypothetical protein